LDPCLNIQIGTYFNVITCAEQLMLLMARDWMHPKLMQTHEVDLGTGPLGRGCADVSVD